MLGKRLRRLRTEKERSTRDMSRMLGLSNSAYSQYETENRAPNYNTLIKLADYFDVSLDYLLGRTEDPDFVILEGKDIPDDLREIGIDEVEILKNIKDEGFNLEELEDIIEFAKKFKSKS